MYKLVVVVMLLGSPQKFEFPNFSSRAECRAHVAEAWSHIPDNLRNAAKVACERQ
jgi:hypothetical protein